MAIQSLTREELLRLLGAAKRRRERDRLMIALAFNHGLRATEVVELRRDNFGAGHITVRRLKGSLKTTQELIAHAEPLLNETETLFDFLGNVPGNQRLFPVTRQRFWQLVQEYGAAAGLPKHKRHPHVLKHSIAMQTIESAGIQNVRQHLGHKSISSTGEYLKVTDDAASAAVRQALRVKPAV
ncbi:MAG TPA: tyrosine-type recombinase/integrase [Acidobacteriaceae bacterium]|nr:tyrosine-type recombinase/integrase [Acidobacteriaceae bacterium]